jgi:tRNA(adenine34) deaminase
MTSSHKFLIEMTDEAFMQLAIQEARKGFTAGEVPVGCVIVREGKVIASAHNLTCVTKNATTHCEINCIR